MEQTVKERTIEFVKYLGINMKTFERQCGLSSGYVTSMRKGFGSEKLSNVLMAYPQLNRDWLLYGEGTMLKSATVKASDSGTPVYDIGISDMGSPCFDAVTLQGGAGRGTGMEALTPDMAVGRMLLPGLPTGSDIPYIQVRGESMVNHRDPSRSIPEGAWVGVKATQSSAIRWGEVYAVMTTDGPIVKKLMPSESEGCIRCVSFNEEGGYLPFDLPVGEIIGPLYKVVGIVSIKVL